MPYILHDDLPGQRPDVIDASAWLRAGWHKDPDQTPPPLPGTEEDVPAEADAESADKPAEQPARRTQKEQQ